MNENEETEARLQICAEQWRLSALRHETQAKDATMEVERRYWQAEAVADWREFHRLEARLTGRSAA